MAHTTTTTHNFTCDRCSTKAKAKGEVPVGWVRLDTRTVTEAGAPTRNSLIDLCEECKAHVEKTLGIAFLPEPDDTVQ